MGRSNKNKVSFSNIRTELPAKFAWAALLSEVCFRGSLWQSEAAGLGQACTAMLTVRRFSKRPEKPFCDPQLQSHFDWTWRQCQRLFRPRGVLQVLAFNTQLFASISAGSTNVAQTITPTSDIMFYQWSKYFFFCCYYSVLGLMKANKSKLTAETKKKKSQWSETALVALSFMSTYSRLWWYWKGLWGLSLHVLHAWKSVRLGWFFWLLHC